MNLLILPPSASWDGFGMLCCITDLGSFFLSNCLTMTGLFTKCPRKFWTNWILTVAKILHNESLLTQCPHHLRLTSNASSPLCGWPQKFDWTKTSPILDMIRNFSDFFGDGFYHLVIFEIEHPHLHLVTCWAGFRLLGCNWGGGLVPAHYAQIRRFGKQRNSRFKFNTLIVQWPRLWWSDLVMLSFPSPSCAVPKFVEMVSTAALAEQCSY